MPSDLSEFIQTISIHNTHEHLWKESSFITGKPDVLSLLFSCYLVGDLTTAGASQDAMYALGATTNPDILSRFNGIKDAWEHCKHTGYGETPQWVAKRYFGIEDISAESIAAAQEKLPELWDKGYLYKLLKEDANYDHVQIDDFCFACHPDPAGPDFFLYDIAWASLIKGDIDLGSLYEESGIEITDLESYRETMSAIFDTYADCAIAVKSLHAYQRTLIWEERSDEDAAKVLEKKIAGTALSEDEMLCLGDWAFARGVELSIKHNLPFKIHTGHYSGNNHLQIKRVRAGHLCPLLMAYPEARFILMHISYPYDDEILSIAKHFPNVWVDMCWAWSINPQVSAQFLRSFIHSVPINKLFGFGGDVFDPFTSVAFSHQTRKWLNWALQQEVDENLLTETEAIHIVQRILQDNQKHCFDLEGTRTAIQTKLNNAN
ncbi:MAG: amidohydrolase family protein [Lentisphaeria bacterium]|nr:amidohydrolase family protein [Lentisphaeria bacterium]